ncbi:MAG TPA: 2-amino-4-hydroxy-6-hydroxymethyldihydropteridine diphosphokinase, partial [Gammaproteobacteria bacterium]|nr:2-amino-4-hydroxy-6-hydroxymethyldihydropteridine diphosphokinase [Gammaproteobacteria bacterium]
MRRSPAVIIVNGSDTFRDATGQVDLPANGEIYQNMVLVGLGSNQGESTEIVIAAMHALARLAQPGSVRSSSLWRTSPVNCPPESGDFINAAVVFDALPDLTPEMLLSRLKTLEREFGRAERYQRNAPRELDLDLLLFGSERRQSEHFTLPHPRAT